MKYILPFIAFSLWSDWSIGQALSSTKKDDIVFVSPAEINIQQDQEYLVTGYQSLVEQKAIKILEIVDRQTAIVTILKPIHDRDVRIAPYHYTHKITLDLNTDVTAYVIVNFRKKVDLLEAQRILKGFTVSQYISNLSYKVKLSNGKRDLQTIAQLADISQISAALENESLNFESQHITHANPLTTPLTLGGRYGLSGANVNIGIGDDSNPNHIDLDDRSIKFSPLNQSPHGSHVSGITAGGGIINELYTGYAPAANMYNHYFSYILEHTPALVRDYQINLTNNSYGANLANCFYLGIYDGTSRAVDNLAIEYPNTLHIFASGNSRQRQCNNLPYGYGTLAGHYQTSKNVLTVANLGKTVTAWNNTSSSGPTQDGRLKPEITAIGTGVYSTGNNNNYFPDNGTSMSAPGVTGASALLTEFYQKKHNALPTAALLKTVLVAGAEDIDQIGPDYHYGFGLMDVKASLDILENDTYWKSETKTTNQRTFEINVPNNTSKLKVLLYWADSLTAPVATNPLHTDLDLKVTDPNNTVHLPWVLNPAAPNLPATKGEDHVNNVEQVTIDQPTAGRYVVNINNYVNNWGSEFYVAYQIESDTIALKFPAGQERIPANTAQTIYWKSNDKTNPITIAISHDLGATWNNIATNISGSLRHFSYNFPNINSTTSLIRITQNNKSHTSAAFSIIGRPVITLAPTAEQCAGNIKINWTAISGIDSFVTYIYKNDGQMHAVDTINNVNTYTYQNLSLDTTYWVGIAALKHGVPSIRSISLSRKPNTGNCSYYDVLIDKIVKHNGRQYTQLAYTNNETLPLFIKSNHNQAINTSPNFTLSINNQSSTHNSNTSLAAQYYGIFNLNNINLATAQTYQISATLNLQDSNTNNNQRSIVLQHFANDPIDLTTPYVIDFEQEQISVTADTIVGIDRLGHFDFFPFTNAGRVQSFVSSDVSINGQRSLTIDHHRNQGANINTNMVNTVMGTFNLSQMDTADDVRLSLKYRLTARPKFSDNNAIYIRANDTSVWYKIADFMYDSLQPALVHEIEGVRINQLLRTNGHAFNTSSFQIKIEQNDTANTGGLSHGNGLTIDDITFFKVQNDIVLDSVSGFAEHLCINTQLDSMRYHITNRANYTSYQVQVGYTNDQNAVVLAVIDSLAAHQDTTIAVALPALFFNNDSFNFTAWVHHPSDTYANNDSIAYHHLYNTPIVHTSQYLERFEQGAGGYYTKGLQSSWLLVDDAADSTDRTNLQYKKAASGTKAWKTGLKHYNNNEKSYLYSPCFDLSTMNHPMLSMHLIANLAAADTLTDFFSVSYSTDGYQWNKLNTDQYRWGNNSEGNWTGNKDHYWHIATTALPQVNTPITLRFELHSDYNTVAEGISIDDIHIYEPEGGIFENTNNIQLSNNIAANQTDSFLQNNQIVAAIQSTNALGNTRISSYKHEDWVDTFSTQYIYPQHFTIVPEHTQRSKVSLYVKDAPSRMIEEDTACITCPKPKGIHNYTVNIYNDPATANESVLDNDTQRYIRLTDSQVTVTPYLDGYQLSFETDRYGEFWLHHTAVPYRYNINDTQLLLSAYWINYMNAHIEAHTKIEESVVSNYGLFGEFNFGEAVQIGEFYKNGSGYYTNIRHITPNDTHVVFYLKCRLANGQILYSNKVTLDRKNMADTIMIYPNPTKDQINIYISDQSGHQINLSVYNAIGQLVSSEALPKVNSMMQTYNFNDRNLARGLYLVVLSIGDKQQTFKIVVE